MHPVQPHQLGLFVGGPGGLGDVGAEVVVPTLAALLAHPALDMLCELHPVVRAVLGHQLRDERILLRRPGAAGADQQLGAASAGTLQ